VTSDETIACQICGEPIGDGAAVYCTCCATPHHRDCWNYIEHCSTYACPGTTCVDDGDEARRLSTEAAERFAAMHQAPVIPKGRCDEPDDLLERPGREPVVLKRPVVAIEVENGIFVIDAKERTFVHQSNEKTGLAAFRRSVPFDEAVDTSVVERCSPLGQVPVRYEYVPVLRMNSRSMMPVSLPGTFVAACTIARHMADHLGLAFVEPTCSSGPGALPVPASGTDRTAHLPRRPLGDDYFALTQMQTAFAAFIGFVGLIAILLLVGGG